MRYALKFAYDGTRFEGYARQPGKSTVEGEVLRALKAKGIADAFQSASRTDKGVSAAGNVIAIDADFPAKGIIPALNSGLEGICFHSMAKVGDGFNPRHARQRHYRYFFPKEGVPPIGKLRKAAKHFIGEHDFRLFSKKDTGMENTVLTIDSIEFSEKGGLILADIKAQRFLWELVRRMLSAVLEVAEGKLKPETAEKMLDGAAKKPGGLRPLAPEFLVLMDVDYGIKFSRAEGTLPDFCDEAKRAELRAVILGQIASSF